jgi:hypothetical protein
MIESAATTPGNSVLSRYEALRGGALGQPVGPDARSGLALLLRSGMWAWAQVMATAPSTRTTPRGADPVALERPSAFVRLLADMTLANVRRTP